MKTHTLNEGSIILEAFAAARNVGESMLISENWKRQITLSCGINPRLETYEKYTDKVAARGHYIKFSQSYSTIHGGFRKSKQTGLL